MGNIYEAHILGQTISIVISTNLGNQQPYKEGILVIFILSYIWEKPKDRQTYKQMC